MAEELNLKLKVDTGAITVPVEDADGEIIGKFKFNPNDWDIIKRYEQVLEVFEKTQVPEKATEADLFRLTDVLKEQLNFLLGYNVSDGLFGKCNPLTVTANGDFYAEQVMDGIGSIIEQVTDQRMRKRKNKIIKATAKYQNTIPFPENK